MQYPITTFLCLCYFQLINNGKAAKTPSLWTQEKNEKVLKKNKQNRKTWQCLRAGLDRKISSMNNGLVSKMQKTLHRFIVSTALIIFDMHYFWATAAPMQCVKTTIFKIQWDKHYCFAPQDTAVSQGMPLGDFKRMAEFSTKAREAFKYLNSPSSVYVTCSDWDPASTAAAALSHTICKQICPVQLAGSC